MNALISKFFPRGGGLLAAALLAALLGGCAVVAVVDTVASTAVGVTKVAVKGTTAVVGAMIPDGDDEEGGEE